MFKYVRYAAYIAFQRSLVSGKAIQFVHCQEFEESGSMMFPEISEESRVKVAVTACNTRDSACSIITSYNRSPFHPSRPYKWMQATDDHMDVKVWEAYV
jgi:hypothetical protein